MERAEDEVRVHDRVPVKIIDIDLDRRRISLSRKQALSARPTETEARPDADIELEQGAPEAAAAPEEAADAAPPEEREDAEAIALMAPGSPVDSGGDAGADREGGTRLDERVSQEQPEGAGARGAAAEAAEDELTPVPESEAPSASGETEAATQSGATGEDSIESIVEDLKRERGQS